MKKVAGGGILVLLIILLTGCWDVQDISNRAYISAIGLDMAEDGLLTNYRVTFEIVQPLLLKEPQKKATLVQTIESPSIGTALQELQARISRQLNMAHVRVLVIGEDLAKTKNFLDISDFFQRNPNIQKRIQLVMVQGGEARDILESNPVCEKYIAKELVSMAQLRFPLAREIRFLDFITGLRVHDGRGFITRTFVSAEDQLIIRHGGGVYNQWKLAGWLSSEETRDANWLVGGDSFTIDAQRDKSIYTYLIDAKSVKITPIADKISPEFDVEVRVTGAIMQQQGDHLDVSDPKVLRQLEQLFAGTIRHQIESAIEKAQKDFRVDYLGFDSVLRQQDPALYQKLDWNQVFPTIPVHVRVESRISRFGLSK